MTPGSARSWQRTVALAVLLGFLPLASACFGSFSLTRKIYSFNKSVSPDKWIRWLVFVALNVVPVYPFANLFDVVFANSVEFWTGSNPLAARLEPQTVVGPHGEVASLVPITNGARIVLTEPSGAVHSMTLLREGPGAVAAYDEHGVFVRRVVGLAGDQPRVLAAAEAR